MTESEKVACSICRKPKAQDHCGICSEPICRSCGEYLDTSTFSFLPKIPENLSHTYYCPNCHQAEVEPALEDYNATMEQAKQAYVFFISQKKAVPMIRKSKETVRVSECDDRDETILRLAFLAVRQGYNAVMEVEVKSEKLRNAGFQKSRWTGVGVPAQVDTERMERSYH